MNVDAQMPQRGNVQYLKQAREHLESRAGWEGILADFEAGRTQHQLFYERGQWGLRLVKPRVRERKKKRRKQTKKGK